MSKERIYQKYRHLLSPVSLFLICFTLISIYSMESHAMFGFFNKTEVQLSPQVKGRITDNGKPLSGVEVVRELFYGGYDKDKPVIDYALTNSNGEFSFEEKIIKSSSPKDVFGQNIPVSQEIYIKKDTSKIESDKEEDKYYWLWWVSKSWRTVPPLNNLMLQLNADLQNRESEYIVDTSGHNVRNKQSIVSICIWDESYILESYDNNEIE